jgi:hypothetical protein
MQTLKTPLKTIRVRKHASQLSTLALTLFALLFLLTAFNCGKRKPPLPPTEKVAQRVEITGIQRGDKVMISWTMPAKNTSDKNVLNIKRADIYRIVEPQNAPLTLSEEEFASSSTLIGVQPITEADFGKKRFTYTDELQFSGQPVRLRYAIRFVNASGQKAAFSNFLIIEPVAKIAGNPKDLTAKLTEQSIDLKWEAPKNNVDNSSPANILGYNVYRSGKLLNSRPVTKTEFSDSSFEFNKEYSYMVRAVSLGNDGDPVESLDSNTIKLLPKDTFPPSAPTAITIAAAPNVISIFFATNPEKDIVGYKIYRSIDATLPKPEWALLTAAPLKTTTFQDKNVEPTKTYYYYVTAIDAAGNVSQPSEVVSETAP